MSLKLKLQNLAVAVLLCGAANAEQPKTDNAVEPIVQFPLNPGVAVTIYCSAKDTGVTTVSFPSRIDGITASRVAKTFDKKNPQPFILGFTAGNSYFSIKSLGRPGVRGAMNVRYNGHTYVFNLDTVTKGHRSITMSPGRPKRGIAPGRGRAVNPKVLLSLMDKAKAYHLFAKEYPEQVRDLGYSLQNREVNYTSCSVLLKEVIRFPKFDTLFFHCQLKNKTKRELRYNPRDFSVNVGHKTFNCSISDASGKIPPEGVTTIYFAITGTSAGGRNNLAAQNEWFVLLPVTELPRFLEGVQPKTVPSMSKPNEAEATSTVKSKDDPSMITPKTKATTDDAKGN
jgi:hypothetical protein